MNRIILFLSLLLFLGLTSGQNCQFLLTIENSYSDLELEDFINDSLVVILDNGESKQIPADNIQKIALKGTRNIKITIKKVLVGSLVGGTTGAIAGLLFSDFALKWLSNKENPKGWISNSDLSEGDKAIVNVFFGMSTVIGILHGVDWGRKKSKVIINYDLSHLSKENKRITLTEIVRKQNE